MPGLSVDIAASPEKVLAAFKRIQEAAKASGRDLKSMADVHFPGLEDAVASMQQFQRGLDQMRSTAIRGNTAATYRSGIKAGLYGPDAVSVLQNAGRQFPGQGAGGAFTTSLAMQAGNLANRGGGGVAGAGGAVAEEEATAGGLGGMMGGILPMAKAILPILGVGLGLGFVGKKVGEAGSQDVGLTDLRRNVKATDESFDSFRNKILASTEGLGIANDETIKLAKEYAALAGVVGSVKIAAGVAAGGLLARQAGIDASQGDQFIGRATRVGVTESPEQSRRLMVEAMVRSGLGGDRMIDAVRDMLSFNEKNAALLGEAGNTKGFIEMYGALTKFGSAGLSANAGTVLGGMDEAIRSGGRAGNAGKNFLYNVIAKASGLGKDSPFPIQEIMEHGLTGMGGAMKHGTGVYALEEIDRKAQNIPGTDKNKDDFRVGMTANLFGMTMKMSREVLGAFDKYKADAAKPGAEEALNKAMAKFEADQKNVKTEGDRTRESEATLSNAMTNLANTLVPALNLMRQTVGRFMEGFGWLMKGTGSAKELPVAARGLPVAAQPNSAWVDKLVAKLYGDALPAGMKKAGVAPSSMFGQTESTQGLPGGYLDWAWSRESHRGDPRFMKSPAGALGHFGFMPDTAKAYKLKDPNDLATSQATAGQMMHDLLVQNHGNMAMAMAGYNWGSKKMRDAGGISHMPKETREYLESYEKYALKQVAAGSNDPRLIAAILDLAEALRGGIPVNVAFDHDGRPKKSAKSAHKIAVPTMATAH